MVQALLVWNPIDSWRGTQRRMVPFVRSSQRRIQVLAAGGNRLLDKHQGLDQAMLFARCAKGACRPIRIHAEMMDVAVHLPKALRAKKVGPN